LITGVRLAAVGGSEADQVLGGDRDREDADDPADQGIGEAGLHPGPEVAAGEVREIFSA
jgi:hypothetical protein